MNLIIYGGIIGMVCGIVWTFSGFSAVLLVLTLGVVGAMIGAIVNKFGGIKNLINQLVSDE
ncbi:hypothetical protein ACFQ22_00540 [Lentilactobacillus raoultii]|uniref:DUF2273 domain-containing protein n=1 Tax=Lentilactobacillus raoultii TaxID=1987503 RepID=A0ABW3PER8_9LACO|nr:hypothetical protein [Lentilactobacillus raoultii]